MQLTKIDTTRTTSHLGIDSLYINVEQIIDVERKGSTVVISFSLENHRAITFKEEQQAKYFCNRLYDWAQGKNQY